jgi:hypothetical protein
MNIRITDRTPYPGTKTLAVVNSAQEFDRWIRQNTVILAHYQVHINGRQMESWDEINRYLG